MYIKITESIHAFLWDSLTENNCNTYLIDGPVRVIIDPGHIAFFDHVRSGLEKTGTGLDDIGLVICTHAHPDHLEAVQLFKDRPAGFAIHHREWEMILSMADLIRRQSGMDLKSFEPDIFLTEGDLSAGTTEMRVFLTPGHSPGAVSIYLPGDKALFTGDLVFRQAVGRTDLPGGDSRQLKESIGRMAELDMEILLPGHGDVISGSDEVRKNFDLIRSIAV